jgi:uncharacterized protein (TIGR02246 family)
MLLGHSGQDQDAMEQFTTPDEVEQTFYRALHDKDIGAMLGVWLDSDAIACIHPMGARLQGRESIMSSWRQIFAGDSQLGFELKGIHRQRSGNLAVHTLHEYITPNNRKDKLTIAVTTNIYQYSEDRGWCMILHHASLSPDTVVERDSHEAEPPNVLH